MADRKELRINKGPTTLNYNKTKDIWEPDKIPFEFIYTKDTSNGYSTNTFANRPKAKQGWWSRPTTAGDIWKVAKNTQIPLVAGLATGAGYLPEIIAGGDAVAATTAGQRLTSGLNFVTNAVKSNKAWPWVDAGLTSIFGAHGIDKVRRGDIHNVGDVVETGLDLLPLSQLAKPVVSTASRVGNAAKNTPKIIDNVAREMFPLYDLYKTIGETTPRTTPTLHSFYTGDLIGNRFAENVYTGSPLFEFGQTMRTSPEKAYFMRAPKDVDILKLENGRFRHEVVGNEVLPSGEVNGKFVSYGEPWKEFALGENSTLYEFPVGSRRGPGLMATDWKGRPQKYSVDEIYDYMQREETLNREFRKDVVKLGLDKLKGAERVKAYRALKEEKYPELLEQYDTSIHGANQTVIPNERWNFDKFLKTPFWKYSENPISGQVQKELMMRWPEAKPLETPTISWQEASNYTPTPRGLISREPLIARGTPEITVDNAAIITDTQWDDAYKTAVESGNRPEALRLLEQAYLRSGIPKTDITVTPEGHAVGWYHGSKWGNHTIFDSSAMNATIGGTSAHGKIKGNFLTTDIPSAIRYAGSNRFSKDNVPEYTSPQTFSEKIKKLFGIYKPRRLYPVERIGDYAPKPNRLFDTKSKPPVDHIDKVDNVVYPLYVNPGKNIMRLDFQGKPWSKSPVEFPNNFYLKRYIRDDVAKTYRDEVIPYKDYETAYKAWTEDPINIYHGRTSLDKKYFDDGIRSIEGYNSAPRYETVRLVEELVPSTTNGAVQTAAKEGKSSILMRNVIDSNGGPDGVHYAIDDFVTLKPNQQKLADITYDDSGNLIPLSQRFNWNKNDIRYSWLAPFLGLGTLGTFLNNVNKYEKR